MPGRIRLAPWDLNEIARRTAASRTEFNVKERVIGFEDITGGHS